jgi:hypothetical protein
MTDNDPIPAVRRVKTSERPFAEDVAIAEAQAPLPPNDIAYQFNNGRTFEEPKNPYA